MGTHTHTHTHTQTHRHIHTYIHTHTYTYTLFFICLFVLFVFLFCRNVTVEISHFHARFIAMFMLYLTGLLSLTLRDYDDDCYPQVRDFFLTFLVISFLFVVV